MLLFYKGILQFFPFFQIKVTPLGGLHQHMIIGRHLEIHEDEGVLSLNLQL